MNRNEHEHHHDCDCHHHHDEEELEDKYHECFNRFQPALTDAEVAEKTARLLAEKAPKHFTEDTLKQLHGLIDLTTLTTLDTKDSVWQMVDTEVNQWEGTRPDVPHVAAVCTYPNFTETVRQALQVKDVSIAAVAAGFPASQTFPEVKIAEVGMAVLAGADEIDVVMNLGLFKEEAYEELTDELQEIKESCRGARLKVILETGALASAEEIHRATILALYSGADFVKTSTGKGYPGATPEAVYTICRVLKQYQKISGRRAGLKVSGGVRTAEDAVKYYTLVRELLGAEWVHKDTFRIGASSLVQDIRKRL
mgnify:FL=1